MSANTIYASSTEEPSIVNKIIMMFCVIVLISVGILMYYIPIGYSSNAYIPCPNFQMCMYEHYDQNSQRLVDNYLQKLRNENYNIISYEIKLENLFKQNIIIDTKDNNEIWKNNLIKNLDIIISCVELHIGNETYYFKDKQQCNTYLDKLETIKKQEYTIVISNQNISKITSEDKLTQKLDSVKEEKAKQDAIEQAKKAAAEKAAKAAQLAKTKTITSRSGDTIRRTTVAKTGTFPVATYSYISSKFGEVSSRRSSAHTGTDFAAPKNTEIYAWKSGTVTMAGWNGSYGNMIAIEHNDGTVSRYAHCNKIAVSVGATVSQGQVIGYVGTTGNSTGYHLHFEILVNGSFVNPQNYL